MPKMTALVCVRRGRMLERNIFLASMAIAKRMPVRNTSTTGILASIQCMVLYVQKGWMIFREADLEKGNSVADKCDYDLIP